MSNVDATVETAAPMERVYVWELPVRITHWVNVIAIFVLAATGFYIGDPFIGGTVYLMGWMRAIHIVFAYVLVAGVGSRICWAFKGNRFASWRVFLPYFSREGRADMKRTFLFYTFLRRQTPGDLGHNALAGMAYSAVWGLLILQMITGFALLSLVQSGWPGSWFAWVFAIVSPPMVHLIHRMIMWLILAFVIHHVYSAILMDFEEKNGVITSIFTGYKLGKKS